MKSRDCQEFYKKACFNYLMTFIIDQHETGGHTTSHKEAYYDYLMSLTRCQAACYIFITVTIYCKPLLLLYCRATFYWKVTLSLFPCMIWRKQRCSTSY